MAELALFNSLTRRKEVFEPLEPGHARVYTCGPTVYSRQHVGNLRSALFADLLVRALRFVGLRVTFVINVTDVGHLTDDAIAPRLGGNIGLLATGASPGGLRLIYIHWSRPFRSPSYLSGTARAKRNVLAPKRL